MSASITPEKSVCGVYREVVQVNIFLFVFVVFLFVYLFVCLFVCTKVEFMYLVYTRMPGERYRRRLRSLLYLRYVFRALITSLCVVCWFVCLFLFLRLTQGLL